MIYQWENNVPAGDTGPRRKYGHMVGACPPTPKEKCRACRLGHPCPVHDEKDIDYEALAKKKRRKKTGRKKGKKRISKGAVERARKK